MSEKTLQIFVGYHKPYFLAKRDFLCPVQGGRAVAETADKDGVRNKKQRDWLLNNTVGDNTGDNISVLNRNFNEMTIEYWVWKNYEQIGNFDYVGFMQYRRHFIFNPKFDEIKRSNHDICYSMFRINHPNSMYFDIIGLNENNIKRVLKDCDVILPRKADFSLIGLESVREDFEKRISGVNVKDLDNFVIYLKKVNPEFGEYFEKKIYESKKYLYLSFITSKKIFMDYANFVFPILLEFNNQLDVSNYSINGQRTIGYLSETLYGIYFDYMKEKKGYKIRELDIAMLRDEDTPDEPKIKVLFRYCKYWLRSKILFGQKRKKYKQRRERMKKKLKNYGPMLIGDKRLKKVFK